jgi:threonine dehydratase
MIEAAAARLKGHARRTPLLSSPFLDEIAGRRVLAKAECLQHTGSFKFRGGWCLGLGADPDTAQARRDRLFLGQPRPGRGLAAQMLGAPAVIIMPEDAPALKIANTRAYGAEVVTYDRAGGESREDLGADARRRTRPDPDRAL